MYAFLSAMKEEIGVYKWQVVTSVGGTVLAFIFGEWMPLLTALLAFVIIDLVTGFAKGIYDKKLRSRKMFDGILRKCLIAVVICVANFLDLAVTPHIINVMGLTADGETLPIIRTMVVLFYLTMELISIAENLGQMNFPLPKVLTDYIELLKEKQQAGNIKKVDEIIVKENGQEMKLKTKGDEKNV
jgi:toxin secretion/phage lysis holin